MFSFRSMFMPTSYLVPELRQVLYISDLTKNFEVEKAYLYICGLDEEISRKYDLYVPCECLLKLKKNMRG